MAEEKETMSKHQRQPVLVIVTGPPGTGKTTLTHRLAEEFFLPALQRDVLKECLFDTLGIGDRAWSQRLGGASYELLFSVLELLLQTGQSCLVESNFNGEPATTKLRTLMQRYGYIPLQIQCRTEPNVLLQRLRQRVLSGERHPGHADHQDIHTLTASDLRGFYDPLELDGRLIHLDTTQPSSFDYATLSTQIAGLLSGEE